MKKFFHHKDIHTASACQAFRAQNFGGPRRGGCRLSSVGPRRRLSHQTAWGRSINRPKAPNDEPGRGVLYPLIQGAWRSACLGRAGSADPGRRVMRWPPGRAPSAHSGRMVILLPGGALSWGHSHRGGSGSGGKGCEGAGLVSVTFPGTSRRSPPTIASVFGRVGSG